MIPSMAESRLYKTAQIKIEKPKATQVKTTVRNIKNYLKDQEVRDTSSLSIMKPVLGSLKNVSQAKVESV